MGSPTAATATWLFGRWRVGITDRAGDRRGPTVTSEPTGPWTVVMFLTDPPRSVTYETDNRFCHAHSTRNFVSPSEKRN